MTRDPLLRLFSDAAIADNFAGGGGASEGIKMALGRDPDVAINHDAEALAMHKANHPTTKHYPEDVFDVDPVEACGGRPCALAWFSPDCTYHSKARGKKPFRDRNRARRIRGLAWVMVRWAKSAVRPTVMFMENVEEFKDWCPLGKDGLPDPAKRGASFRRFLAALRNAGYQVEHGELRASDFGSPTSRKRLFLIARCDGKPIVWPKPTHGPAIKALKPYRTAAECIDFTIPVPSIFLTPKEARAWAREHGCETPRRPLATATLRRIARGVSRYVLEAEHPFIVNGYAPTLIQTSYGERKGQAPRTLNLFDPLGTVVAGGIKHSLVTAFLAKHNGGHEATGQRLTESMMTVKVTLNQKGTPIGQVADAELHFTEGPLAGMKLIGFGIWERRGGSGRNVTFPARQYSINGERRSFALLRPIVDTAAQDMIRELILEAVAKAEDAQAVQS